MLHVIDVGQAQALARRIAKKKEKTEVLPLSALTGRVTAEDLISGEEIPAFRRSTMDGYAVTAKDVFGAGEASPVFLDVIGQVQMGEKTRLSLTPGACAKIPTGGMLPEHADAVVPVEYTDVDGFGTCLVYRPVSPNENVTQIGDDVRKNARIFAAGTRLSPSKIGVLAACGIDSCRVYEKPCVGILSTGNEILPVSSAAAAGKVRDVNSHLLEALCVSFGCQVRQYGIVGDDEEALRETLRKASAEADLVLLSGGSSAGEMDLTGKVIGSLGEVLAHGIAMKPGKPTVIGQIGNTPVFGLPGHPAACYFVTETVVKPCVEEMTRAPLPEKKTAARISEHISSNHGREEFLCVSLKDGTAAPVYGKSGIVSQLSSADGYIRIGRDCEGLGAGSTVDIYLF